MYEIWTCYHGKNFVYCIFVIPMYNIEQKTELMGVPLLYDMFVTQVVHVFIFKVIKIVLF